MTARAVRVVEATTDATVIPLRPALDDWGRDNAAVQIAHGMAMIRWSVSVGGAHHLPAHGAALVVASSRRFAQTVPMVAWALQRRSGRAIRFVGRPDVAPLSSVVQRLGGLRLDPAEVHGALAHGEIVVVGTEPVRQTRRAGAVPEDLLTAAWQLDVPVIPAAAVSSPFTRRARVELDEPVRPLHRRRGPLGPWELAEQVRRHLQAMLAELGGVPVLDLIGEA